MVPNKEIIEMMYRKLFIVKQLAKLVEEPELGTEDSVALTKTQNLLDEIDKILEKK